MATDLKPLIDDLVTANRILAHEGVLDSFGHVSVRHPDNTGQFMMSRARAPEQVEAGDIITFTHEGKPVSPNPLPGKPYSERFIHGAIYEARPDAIAVVHNHSESVVPFSVMPKVKLRPLMHMAGPIGTDINIWDSHTKFGDTNLLVTSIEMGRDMAKAVGNRNVSLLRGHGCVVIGKSIREVVFTSIYLEINAKMQTSCMSMGNEINFLTPGESALIERGRAGFTLERGWENWCKRAGRSYVPGSNEMGEGFSKTDPTG